MKTFTTFIVDMMKEESLFASQGGPIIAAQIENEYSNIDWAYGNDAPLDEYGNLNQPKWGHLKQLLEIILSMEETLAYGDRHDVDYGNMVSGTIWSHNGKQSCMLGNANNYQEFTVDLMGSKFTVPAWSVTILPDCHTETYNTAKVSVQRSNMVKLLNGEGEDNDEGNSGLTWLWRPEGFEQLRNGSVRGSLFTVNQLLDQKAVTNDTSDYLWYLTSVDIKPDDSFLKTVVTLQIRTEGHVLHAFVNGRYNMPQSGLKNYGAHYDDDLVGVHGPVTLISNKGTPMEVVKVLTGNPWTYKVGLQGMERGVFKETRRPKKWRANSIPSNRMFVWYKTMFEAPLGTDPVVMDLLGLGKGTAWVNGKNIGRYWLTFLAGSDSCSNTCDYRGSYNSNKCLTNCGKPTQRYYHIPRSWLKNGNNELVPFEELGGTPMNIKLHAVTVGSMCATPYEGQKLELSCQGGWVINQIKFASFGAPMNSCGSFRKGPCEAPNTLSVIEKLLNFTMSTHNLIRVFRSRPHRRKTSVLQECLGKDSCTVEVSENKFGSTGCNLAANKLAVEAVCGKYEQ
ncbi:hypothetical protein MLD38_019590 [Melastoma candidum]|uniref:Uncharacterized protein n=1 Tax=Melastoma candidum TaxID=119954 RepID=A0ACB9R1I1_9MYRT|nr:hypothetical protein MLD38_019590 [Melastoma candidum]